MSNAATADEPVATSTEVRPASTPLPCSTTSTVRRAPCPTTTAFEATVGDTRGLDGPVVRRLSHRMQHEWPVGAFDEGIESPGDRAGLEVGYQVHLPVPVLGRQPGNQRIEPGRQSGELQPVEAGPG